MRERAAVLPNGLGALRAWLAAGAGERWLHYEAVVQRAREQDLALAMWRIPTSPSGGVPKFRWLIEALLPLLDAAFQGTQTGWLWPRTGRAGG